MKHQKIIKIIVLSILSLLLLSFLLVQSLKLYYNHLEPAYNSYLTDCDINNKIKQNLKEKGYITPAQTSVQTNKTTGDQTITVTFYGNRTEEERKGDAKHEQCHLNQIYQNRLNNCLQPIRLYLDELECSFSQDYNDLIYERLYGKMINFSEQNN